MSKWEFSGVYSLPSVGGEEEKEPLRLMEQEIGMIKEFLKYYNTGASVCGFYEFFKEPWINRIDAVIKAQQKAAIEILRYHGLVNKKSSGPYYFCYNCQEPFLTRPPEIKIDDKYEKCCCVCGGTMIFGIREH